MSSFNFTHRIPKTTALLGLLWGALLWQAVWAQSPEAGRSYADRQNGGFKSEAQQRLQWMEVEG